MFKYIINVGVPAGTSVAGVQFQQQIRIKVELKHLGFGSVTSVSGALRPLKANTLTPHTFTSAEIDVESPETLNTRRTKNRNVMEFISLGEKNEQIKKEREKKP